VSRPNTKVVATIGPASEPRIGELIDAGMSVARLNFSHSKPEDHERRARIVRQEADERGEAVAILADIQGPKLRLGLFEETNRRLEPGDRVRLLEGSGTAGPEEIFLDAAGVVETIEPGHRVYLADGAVEVKVEDSRGGVLTGVVRRGGWIGNKKGFHLPDSTLTLELPTPKDLRDLELATRIGVDMIGASFIGCAEDVRRVRAHAPDATIVAKIERAAAVERLDEILAEAEGVMVARGDLGVEMDLEMLPIVQKDLLVAARRAGKFTITATEMLESMVHASRPTRAEVADVATAVLDGTDALMLSAESAVGEYPVESVATMISIASAVEASERYRKQPRIGFRESEPTFSNAVARSAVLAAEALGIRHIVCFTETGNTVRLLSRYRPSGQIVALTPHARTVRSMAVLAHVLPLAFERHRSLEEMLATADRMLLERGICARGEEVVFVAGVPAGVARSTNVMKMHRIGEHVQLH
jgi:pyruvate kinase